MIAKTSHVVTSIKINKNYGFFNMGEQLWRIPSAFLHKRKFLNLISSKPIYLTPCDTDSRHVLPSIQKISHLQLDIELFKSDIYDFLGCTPVKENLKDLRRFDIVRRYNCCKNNNDHAFIYEENCTDNILKNCGHFILLRLKSLFFPKMRFDEAEAERREMRSSLMMLHQRNHGTLRELSLHLEFWNQDDICALKLPRL